MRYAQPNIIQASDPVSKVISMLEKSGVGVLVFEGKKYVGTIDERQVQSHSSDPSKLKAGKLAVKTPVIGPSDDIYTICQAFFAGRFKTLPVMEKEKLLGTVNRWDILQELSGQGFLTGHKVEQFMSSPILTIDAAAPVSAAHSTMRDANVRRLAVVENGHLVGVVSIFDILKSRSKPRGRQPEMRLHGKDESIPVSSFMKSEVHTIKPEATLAQAVGDMLGKQMAGLIVSDGRRPVGILTFKDIMEAVMRKEAELPIFVSGLHDVEKEMTQDVVAEGEKLMMKLGKSIGAQALSIHIKQTGNQYYASAHIRGKRMLRATYSAFDLIDAVKSVLEELKSQAVKTKSEGMWKRENA